jgi:hypothetical protein
MQVGDSPPYMADVEEVRTLTGTEELFGRDYIVEEQVSLSDDGSGPDTNRYWYRYRQDKAGLYEADYAITYPPGTDMPATASGWEGLWQRAAAGLESGDPGTAATARMAHFRKLEAVMALLGRGAGRQALAGPPGDLMPDELLRLQYPLHTGQEWVVRDAPYFASVAERHEVLDLPAGMMNGWRIAMISELFGEGDAVYFWYGRSGFLGMSVHLESETMGLDGSMVTVVSDETLWLESFDIDGKGDPAEPAEGKKAESKEEGFTLR